MKNQSFGCKGLPASSPFAASLIRGPCSWPLFSSLSASLKDYREQRENGDERDNPKAVFPSAGADVLGAESSTWQGSSKWPDKVVEVKLQRWTCD